MTNTWSGNMNEDNYFIRKMGESGHNLPNPIMLSRQIDGLREVMRRMQTTQSDSFDALISKKLEKITQA